MSTAAAGKRRPKYLSLRALLFEIRLPLPGWISILHRVSGALLFLAALGLLWLLDRSLASAEDFAAVQRVVALPPVKLVLLVLIWAYCHHFFAGIRFLLLDLDRGVERSATRAASLAVLVASLALTAFLGARLW